MSIEDDHDPIETVDEQAADWIVRQDGDGLSREEQALFDRWIEDPMHRAAYDRHNAVWARYQSAGATMAVMQSQSAPRRFRRRYDPRPVSRSPVSRRPVSRKLVASAIAACLALVVIGHVEDWPMRLRADFATGIGERRTVKLADGSTARLDARSAIAFAQTGGRRVVQLLEGSAAFDVAADRAHPFTVETGSGSVTALGTAFAVRREDGAAQLVVTQHSVSVLTAQGQRAIVHEGEGADFSPGRVTPPRPIDVTAATGWTRGKLFVFDQPLGEVVARIAQERRVYWTVRGDAAAIRVNGVYDLNEPTQAIAMLQSTLNLRAFRLSDRFIILSR